MESGMIIFLSVFFVWAFIVLSYLISPNKSFLAFILSLLFFLIVLSASLAWTQSPEPAEVSEPPAPMYVRHELSPNVCYEQIGIIESCHEVESETESNVYYDVPLDNEMQDYIRDTLGEFDLDISNGLELVLAIAYTESRFHADSKNGNCKGIMQVSEIHKDKLNELEVRDLFDPYDCFRAGIYFLKSGFDNADSLWEEVESCELSEDEFRLNCALMSYNLGNYGAEKKIKRGVYSTSYVEKVREAMVNLEVKNE